MHTSQTWGRAAVSALCNMVSVGVSEDLLREQSWVPVCLGGVQLLAKSWFADTAYRLLLSDLQCVWEEEMDAAAIQDRAQDLNKRLRAPVSAFFSHLCTVACPRLTGGGGGELEENVDPAEFSLLRSHDCLEVRLKSELAGVPFYWEFRCTPAAVTVVCRHFVQPLLAVSRVLQRQVGELGALLSRKDAEIQDYKENGAELSRARLKTEVFEEQSYREGFIAQEQSSVVLWVRQRAAQLGQNLDPGQQRFPSMTRPPPSTKPRPIGLFLGPGRRKLLGCFGDQWTFLLVCWLHFKD
ncbi:non-homologous end-joining factor 1 isoform X3 [Conger conger]|uniref:non-homologous end-joining factor 1 isoform X3 n=1 Tax=Conger conger TaxID=82655 RepID=UPI002A59F8F2|nr:non-homologous end-joining factor 1 isoform X3 [Conger conger]